MLKHQYDERQNDKQQNLMPADDQETVCPSVCLSLCPLVRY